MTIDTAKSYTATLKTNMGDMVIALDVKNAPKTVNNFVFLAQKDFYDGTIFHRVIKDFMIQGGDPDGIGTGGPGYQFEDEINAAQVFNKAGLLAMANSGPNTNGSQFFITQKETPWLTGNHTIFGAVTKGMDIVDKIALTATGNNDKPLKDVIITDVVIEEK
ncbi:peptidylprolyl isomerase [Candidatus Woesebacteria bacterium]|nr:peptidylprolyl isomerase [Candidatus Woesebacteria bacterium]